MGTIVNRMCKNTFKITKAIQHCRVLLKVGVPLPALILEDVEQLGL